MKAQIKIIATVVALLLGASVAAWSQQPQTDNPTAPDQKVSVEHTQTSGTANKTFTAEEKRTKSEGTKTRATDKIAVVGHLPLQGDVISNIRTTEDQTRPLLEVTDKTNQTLNMVDVADPAHPKIVERMRKPADLKNSRLEVAVGDAALFAETQDAAAQPRSITIVNFADHVGPKTERRFDNVTALWTDRARGFIYLANPEGLWILQPNSLADRIAFQKQYDDMLRNALTP